MAEGDGERLTDEEIVGFVGLLLLAGHITTTATLGNTVLCFEAHPDAAAEVRADPALLPAAIEEVLRLRTPFPRLARRATADVTVGRTAIPAGAVVVAWLAAANRDERVFAEPDRFDAHRSPTLTSPSDTGSISVSARPWPAWRRGSRWGSCLSGTATSRSTPRADRVPQPVGDGQPHQAAAGGRRSVDRHRSLNIPDQAQISTAARSVSIWTGAVHDYGVSAWSVLVGLDMCAVQRAARHLGEPEREFQMSGLVLPVDPDKPSNSRTPAPTAGSTTG